MAALHRTPVRCASAERKAVREPGTTLSRSSLSTADSTSNTCTNALRKATHQRSLRKLRAHDKRDSTVNWVRNWLTGRKQRATVEGGNSSWITVHSGVSQGSMLCPLLFLIYSNDLDDTVVSNILKFVDDTKIYRKVPRSEQDSEVLQEDLGGQN